MYTVDYFINKFIAIPDSRWASDDYIINFTDHVSHCALGHCGMESDDSVTREGKALIGMVANHLRGRFIVKHLDIANNPDMDMFYVIEINDDITNSCGYGDTPKERVVNLLKEIKAENPYVYSTKMYCKVTRRELCLT